MALSLHGVTLPHRKDTSGKGAVRMSAPASVALPTSMHIGKPASVCVKPGDKVCVGDVIAEQDGFISSYVHASVSGTVKAISEVLLSSGASVPAIIIESDSLMTPSDSIQPPKAETREQFVDAVAKSGLVGLGGAGFPTYVKFSVGPDKSVEELIINGAECEPYITSDSLVMEQYSEDILNAILIIKKLFTVKRVIIGIEKNKPGAIRKMKEIASRAQGIEVKVLKTLYPQGGEKVLIYHTTGKKVPMGKLPIDVGCIVCNSTTMATLGAYLKTGMPLVEKYVTVDGSAVKNPQNVIVPLGTSMNDVFEFCGGFCEQPEKVLYGGPMMGISVPDLSAPILKNNNAILAFGKKLATAPETTACIRCGNCVNHCPFGINPYAIANAFKQGDLEKVEKLGVNLCMECGCCSYICPARRPLVQTNRLAKAALRQAAAEKKKREEKE